MQTLLCRKVPAEEGDMYDRVVTGQEEVILRVMHIGGQSWGTIPRLDSLHGITLPNGHG